MAGARASERGPVHGRPGHRDRERRVPSIKVDLGFSQENLQWVISAYALVFGGFLLLGGRAADLLGRRRVFLVGFILFTLASLLAGLAWSEASLIAARSLQGLGAAVISPAALSILSTTFTEGRERNIALGVWGAVGGFGAAAGVLLGGILTETLSWAWIFFVNVPVGVAAFLLAPRLLDESRDATVKTFDIPGAVLVTGGLCRSSTRSPRAAHTAGARHGRSASSRRGRTSGRVRRVGAPAPRAADALRHPPHEDGRGRERRRADPRHCHVLAVPDADAVHAAGARLLTDEDGRGLSRSRRERDPLVGGRGAAREPHRREAGTRRRHGRADQRPRVLHAGVRSRHVSQRPTAGLPARGRRPRLLVRADLDRCARRRRPAEAGLASGCSTRRSRSAARSASRCCRRSRRREHRTQSRRGPRCRRRWCTGSPAPSSPAPASRRSASSQH